MTTVALLSDSLLAGPAGREARRRTRWVGSSVMVCSAIVIVDPPEVVSLERPWIEHQINPILGDGRAAHSGSENTSAAGGVGKGAGVLVVGGVGLRLRARLRWQRTGALRWWRSRQGLRVRDHGRQRRIIRRHPRAEGWRRPIVVGRRRIVCRLMLWVRPWSCLNAGR